MYSAKVADLGSATQLPESPTLSRQPRDPEAQFAGTFGKVSASEPEIETGKSDVQEPHTTAVLLNQNSHPDVRYKLNLRHRLKHADLIDTFFAVQEWEGYVVAINADNFTARLLDISAGGTKETEEADLPLSDLSFEERQNLKPGAVFRWAIGYEISKKGQRKRTSQIIFRQLPRWTQDELTSALKRGEERAARIRSE
jgi:hypothetical protein